nr:zinc-finger-containing protein [Paraburkholderia aspalathi]
MQGMSNNALAFALIKTGLVKARPAQSEIEARPSCQYCGSEAKLVTGEVIYPRLSNLHGKHFWHCAPCGAWVGCHDAGNGYGDGTRPLGELANAELREAKKSMHAAFDPIWQSNQMRRKQAYQWLADALGIPVDKCHVGMFSIEQCVRAKAICEAYRL